MEKELIVNGEWLHLSLRAFEESVAISMCSAISWDCRGSSSLAMTGFHGIAQPVPSEAKESPPFLAMTGFFRNGEYGNTA